MGARRPQGLQGREEGGGEAERRVKTPPTDQDNSREQMGGAAATGMVGKTPCKEARMNQQLLQRQQEASRDQFSVM